MVMTLPSVAWLVLMCAGVILTIKLAKRAWQHRAIRIMVLVPLVTTLVVGGLFLFSGVPARHRLGPQIWHGPSSPRNAIRNAAVSAREFARDRIDDGRIAVQRAAGALKAKAEELRHSEAIQEYKATLTAEATDDCDNVGVTAMLQAFGPDTRSWNWRVVHGSVLWSLIAAAAIGAFLYVSYILLDASTRGHFSWPLRLAAVGGFGVIYAALALLRH